MIYRKRWVFCGIVYYILVVFKWLYLVVLLLSGNFMIEFERYFVFRKGGIFC